jgi:regulator of replication initiation timing
VGVITEPGITHESAELGCLRRTVKKQREEITGLRLEMDSLRRRGRILAPESDSS